MKIAIALGTLSMVGGAAQASLVNANGYATEARIFNDQPGTSLTINGVSRPTAGFAPVAGLAGPLHFVEQFTALTPGGNTNKHVGWFSDDGGATRTTSQASQSFQLRFDVTMNAPAGQPRKEAGIEVHQPRPNNIPPFTDEGQVLIASDGEVAVFGAAMPFTGLGFVYTLGTTAHVSFTYYAPGDLGSTQAAYRLIFDDAVTGVHDSGFKYWGMETDGINGFTDAFIGLKAQNSRNPFINDTSDILYNGVSIPAPGVAGLLGLGGLVAMGRRRVCV